MLTLEPVSFLLFPAGVTLPYRLVLYNLEFLCWTNFLCWKSFLQGRISRLQRMSDNVGAPF